MTADAKPYRLEREIGLAGRVLWAVYDATGKPWAYCHGSNAKRDAQRCADKLNGRRITGDCEIDCQESCWGGCQGPEQ